MKWRMAWRWLCKSRWDRWVNFYNSFVSGWNFLYLKRVVGERPPYCINHVVIDIATTPRTNWRRNILTETSPLKLYNFL